MKALPLTGLGIIMLLATVPLNGQTTGNLNFTFTTSSTGGYTPKHLMAVWIENGSSAFVKTKLKMCSSDNLDHLNTWTSKSGNNVADATTGATMTSHGTVTVTWNGTAANGSVVPDGNYSVWIEMAWANSMSTGKTVQSFAFTKGPNAMHLTPANLVNFSNITLDWTPSASGIVEEPVQPGLRIWPNPTSGSVTVEIEQVTGQVRIGVFSLAGQLVRDERIDLTGSLVREIDLGDSPNGVYFVKVSMPDGKLVGRTVKLLKVSR